MSDGFFCLVLGMELFCFVGVLIFMCLFCVGFEDVWIVDVDVGIIGVFWDSGMINCSGLCYGL